MARRVTYIRSRYMLREAEPHEVKGWQDTDTEWQVHWTEAHKYVRDGGVHGTYLWIDMDGRMRRANPEPV